MSIARAPMPHNKAVILGASGFIGVNLAHALVRQGHQVVCFARTASPDWPPEAEQVIGEFADLPPQLLAHLAQAVVYHLIASGRPSPNTAGAAQEAIDDIGTTLRYFEYCRERAVRWVFVSSGGTVYGHTSEDMLAELAPNHPICSYGVVKLAIEQYLALYRRLHGTDYVVVRLANPYGAWQRPLTGQGLVATLLYKVLKGDSIEVWGNGENVRDYIYIDDAVDGLLAAASHGESGETYNLGTGVGTSINQLIGLIKQTLGVDVAVRHTPARAVDVERNVLQAEKLAAVSGWQPQTGLVDGLLRTATWIKSHVL
ncbi:NAD-dependent epimerase/dehydratase family protein [Massilia eburnea]|nr:NAD-dependent epimerase/dehydratase family protein [Massilia eburnea]